MRPHNINLLMNRGNGHGVELRNRNIIIPHQLYLLTSRKKISAYSERFEGYVKALVQGGREADAIHVVYLDSISYTSFIKNSLVMSGTIIPTFFIF